MKKLIIGLIILSLILIGCIQEIQEAKSKKEYCLNNNMTFDDTYVLQPNWTRCCKDPIPTNYGTYRYDCDYYLFTRIEVNDSVNSSNIFRFSQGNDTTPIIRFKLGGSYVELDFSIQSFIKVMPHINSSSFIYLECINSTLVINETMLYCERREN